LYLTYINTYGRKEKRKDNKKVEGTKIKDTESKIYSKQGTKTELGAVTK